MIKNLIFDFGKVLVDYDFDKVLRMVFDNPEEMALFKKLICGDEFISRCDKEDIPFRELINEAQALYPEWKMQLEYFHDHATDLVTGEVEGMNAVLEKYRNLGYRLYGLTNWSSVVYQVIPRYEILRKMEGTVISSDEKLIKPDPAIYRRLLERYSLKPEECVFTDDKQANIDGAISVGMNAILFRNSAQYEEELAELL